MNRKLSESLEREFEMEMAWIGKDADVDYDDEKEYGIWLKQKLQDDPELLERLMLEIANDWSAS